MRTYVYENFQLTPEMVEKAITFFEEQDAIYENLPSERRNFQRGKGKFSFTFSSSGIGPNCVATHQGTGASLDISDYESW